MRPVPDAWPRTPLRDIAPHVTVRLTRRAAESLLVAVHSLPQGALLPEDEDALLEAEIALSRALRPRMRPGAAA
jgi:hypothetical protein